MGIMTTELLLDEIAAGRGIYLSRAARLLPSYRQGRPVTISCLVRWILQGTQAPDGSRVRLEAVKGPAGWITAGPALARYLAARTPELGSDTPTSVIRRTLTARRKASERAARELDAIGI
jgi:hypothetical protein